MVRACLLARDGDGGRARANRRARLDRTDFLLKFILIGESIVLCHVQELGAQGRTMSAR